MLAKPMNIDEFLSENEEEFDWLIPGLIERGDRTIITGNEGMGKTTLFRQMAIQIASGTHPFTLDPVTPRRVLFVDLENPRRIMRRKMREMKSDADISEGYLKVATYPQGLDLRNDLIREEFTAIIKDVSPDVLFIGPIYKMWNASLESDQESLALAMYLDAMRTLLGFAIFIEAHQPHSTITSYGKPVRPPRPIGSSLWVRWPEFGMMLEDNGTLKPWRGHRDEREWPEKLKRFGATWPWELFHELDAAPSFCLKCGTSIPEGRTSYCSDKCSASYRQSLSRKRKSTTINPELLDSARQP